MAKRSLARTIIEGGRVGYTRYEEHLCTRAERHQSKVVLRSVKDGLDEEDFVIEHRSTATWKEFADRLSPLAQWLQAQAGRPWDDIYSEIRSKFDIRKVSNWHLIGHIKSTVSFETHDHRYKGRLVVDSNGILRYSQKRFLF